MASFIIRDYMSARRLSFAPTMDVLEAIDLLVSENISGAPVIDDRGRLLGFFSEKDCMFLATQVGFHNERVGDVADHMTSPAEAARLVGLMKLSGKGTEKNPKDAKQWLSVAAQKGDGVARRMLEQYKSLF